MEVIFDELRVVAGVGDNWGGDGGGGNVEEEDSWEVSASPVVKGRGNNGAGTLVCLWGRLVC